MELIRGQGQVHLPCAAQFAEPREDETDRLLEPQVWIEAEPCLSMPHVAGRHAEPQLATSRLGTRCVVHSRTKDAKLELADAAFHSQQKSVVRTAWVINPVEIYDARADKAAEFQQVMPIAPIAGEARSIETQHGSDIAGAKPRDKLIEARPGYRPARRTSEIVVDDIDIAEAAAARFVDQIVLTTLAFEVGLNLGLGRLPDVYDGLPLQDCRREEISVGHRRPPPLERRPPPASRGWPGVRQPSVALASASSKAVALRTRAQVGAAGALRPLR